MTRDPLTGTALPDKPLTGALTVHTLGDEDPTAPRLRTRILATLAGADSALTGEQIADACGSTPKSICGYLVALRREGLIESNDGRHALPHRTELLNTTPTPEPDIMAKPRTLSKHAEIVLNALAAAAKPMTKTDILAQCTDSSRTQIEVGCQALRRRGFATISGPLKFAVWAITPAGCEYLGMEEIKLAPAPDAPKVTRAFKPHRPAAPVAPARIDSDRPATPDFLPAIAADGSLLLFESGNGQLPIEALPYCIRPDHARALVAFLRTLPEQHELSLPDPSRA